MEQTGKIREETHGLLQGRLRLHGTFISTKVRVHEFMNYKIYDLISSN